MRQDYAEQLELSGWWRALADIVGEAKISCEANLEVLDGELIEPPIVQALHPKGMNGFDFVTFRAQGGDEFPGQILVEQNFHAGWSSLRCASSARTLRTDSSVRLG